MLAVVMMGFTACKNNAPECKYHAQTLDLTVMQPDWQIGRASCRERVCEAV